MKIAAILVIKNVTERSIETTGISQITTHDQDLLSLKKKNRLNSITPFKQYMQRV